MTSRARLYTRVQVLRHVSALECPDSAADQRKALEQHAAAGDFGHAWWRLTRAPLARLESVVPAGDELAARYLARRRAGERFPAIVLTELPFPDDGQHRVTAAKEFGDRYIDTFVPAEAAAWRAS